MNSFGLNPFLRILPPFIAGILADIYYDLPDSAILFLFFFTFILITTDYLTVNLLGKFSLKILNGSILTLMFFLAGAGITSLQNAKKSDKHFSHVTEENYFRVQLIRDPVLKEKSVKLQVKMLDCANKKEAQFVKGNALLYLEINEQAQNLSYGDILTVKTIWNEISPPKNPGEFDYRKYCTYHRFDAQGYADANHWKKTGEGGNPVYKAAMLSRKELLAIFRDAGLEGSEFAVASALILGYTDEIDDETMNAYSASGALHVLSVSGLHVAIIFAVFDKLFAFLLLFKRGNLYKAVLILFLLWGYAFLTGLSPSVMRSAAMLSFVVVGKAINRNASIYNILGASAFCLLLFDPYLLLDVGFQLSYLAVLGIVYLHPKIYGWFYVKNRILDFFWNMTAVSIAAQLITTPISIFYFHQFPNYFLLGNFVVIPLGTIILYNGILALVFSFIPGISDFLIFTLKWSVKILNESVIWIEQLPYSVTSGFSLTVFECLITYIILITIFIFFHTKKTIWLMSAMCSVIVLFTVFAFGKWQLRDQKRIIVYHVRKSNAIDFISGKEHLFVANEKLDDDKMNFHIYPHWNLRKLNEPTFSSPQFFRYKNYFSFDNIRMVMIDSNFRSFVPKVKLKVEYIVISNDAVWNLNDVLSVYECKTIIADASNSRYRVERWKNELSESKMTKKCILYDVGEEGAFIYDL